MILRTTNQKFALRIGRLVFLFGPSILLLSGCQLGKPLRPLTPSQLNSGELSRAGNAAMEKGNWTEAEKKLEEAVRLNKKDTELRRHYAEALWMQGKRNESLQQLSEAEKRGGGSEASLHISLAEKYLEIEDFERAYRHADEAVRLAPREVRGWLQRGTVERILAQRHSDPEKRAQLLSEARNDFYRALSLSPNHRDVLPQLAAVQILSGRPEQALASWQNLQELFPPNGEPAELLRGKAEAYIALHRLEDAATCLEAARRREPGHPEIEQRLREVVALSQASPRH